MNAVGYLRASTLSQDISPDAQRSAIGAYASAHGLTVASWHSDIGISGATPLPKRPGLLDALSSLRSLGKGSVLIVAKRDRLARDVVIAATVEAMARKVGCTVASADGSGNGDTPADALMRTLLDAMAQFERALISMRTRAAMAVRRSRGQPTSGTAPTGYRIDGDRLLEVPREMEAVRLAQALHASGMGFEDIARELWSRGYRSRSGTRIPRSTVARWLARLPMPAGAVAV